MATAFSLPLPLIVVLFGLIDKEYARFITILEIGIGLEIDNGLLLLDFTKCMRSGFSDNYSWSVLSSKSLTIMDFSKTSVQAQTWWQIIPY